MCFITLEPKVYCFMLYCSFCFQDANKDHAEIKVCRDQGILVSSFLQELCSMYFFTRTLQYVFLSPHEFETMSPI